MRVFVAGASGAIGRRLVPLLVSMGHQVVGSTTSPAKLRGLEHLGAAAVQLDVLDADATRRAVADAKPDVVVHQATSLAALGSNMRHLDRAFAVTNQLRTAGTQNLLAAAADQGVSRFVAQSFCGLAFARSTDVGSDAPEGLRAARSAIRDLEDAVVDTGGVVLRYGGFYGPGTSLGRDGEQTEAVRKRMLPIVGRGSSIFQFIHIDDAATATLAALATGAGIYDIVDDEPAPLREWVPYLAQLLGARPARRVPVWLGKLFAGEGVAVLTVEAPPTSNARAKSELGWKPVYPSWRDGFKHEFG